MHKPLAQRRVLKGLAATLALALAAGPVRAWGPDGHQTVGAIADQLIAGTPAAKKVRAILGSTLQMASVWADCARSVESKAGMWTYVNPGEYKACAYYENADSQKALIAFVKRNASRCGGFATHVQCRHKAWHFTDISLQHAKYDPALPGAAPNDLVQAIAASITALQGGKPPADFNIASQKEALRLLTHFVGDVHQPLHVGSVYLDDQGHPMDPADEKDAHAHSNAGGNQILVKASKLHGLWDDVPGKLTTTLQAGTGAKEARDVKPASGPIAQWPADWASETIGEAAGAFKGLKIGAKVGDNWPATTDEPAYRQARENLQHAQLVKAGARLAQILTTLFP